MTVDPTFIRIPACVPIQAQIERRMGHTTNILQAYRAGILHLTERMFWCHGTAQSTATTIKKLHDTSQR